MENKICSACSAVNDPSFIFCCKCGNSLGGAGEAAQSPDFSQNYTQQQSGNFNPNQPFGPGAYGPGAYNPDGMVDDITSGEAAAYIGAKAHHFLPKFQEMSATGSKTNFNIMLFILSFFVCGPIIVAFWLISKKVYKEGAIVFGVCTALSLSIYLMMIPMLTTIVEPFRDALDYAYTQSGESFTSEYFWEYAEEYFEQNNLRPNIDNLLSSIMGFSVFSVIYSLVNLVFSIYLPMKANYWYKNHVVRKVKEARSQGRGSLPEIAATGGTTAIWVAFLAGYLFLSLTLSVIIIYSAFHLILSAASSLLL